MRSHADCVGSVLCANHSNISHSCKEQWIKCCLTDLLNGPFFFMKVKCAGFLTRIPPLRDIQIGQVATFERVRVDDLNPVIRERELDCQIVASILRAKRETPNDKPRLQSVPVLYLERVCLFVFRRSTAAPPGDRGSGCAPAWEPGQARSVRGCRRARSLRLRPSRCGPRPDRCSATPCPGQAAR